VRAAGRAGRRPAGSHGVEGSLSSGPLAVQVKPSGPSCRLAPTRFVALRCVVVAPTPPSALRPGAPHPHDAQPHVLGATPRAHRGPLWFRHLPRAGELMPRRLCTHALRRPRPRSDGVSRCELRLRAPARSVAPTYSTPQAGVHFAAVHPICVPRGGCIAAPPALCSWRATALLGGEEAARTQGPVLGRFRRIKTLNPRGGLPWLPVWCLLDPPCGETHPRHRFSHNRDPPALWHRAPQIGSP
jgi:hypothetical protein